MTLALQLTIKLVGPHKKGYEFHAESREDKQRWIKAISDQLERMELDSTGAVTGSTVLAELDLPLCLTIPLLPAA